MQWFARMSAEPLRALRKRRAIVARRFRGDEHGANAPAPPNPAPMNGDRSDKHRAFVCARKRPCPCPPTILIRTSFLRGWGKEGGHGGGKGGGGAAPRTGAGAAARKEYAWAVRGVCLQVIHLGGAGCWCVVAALRASGGNAPSALLAQVAQGIRLGGAQCERVRSRPRA